MERHSGRKFSCGGVYACRGSGHESNDGCRGDRKCFRRAGDGGFGSGAGT